MIQRNLKKLKRWRAFDTEELRIIAAKLGEQVSSKLEETIFKDAYEAFCERQGIQPLWDKKVKSTDEKTEIKEKDDLGRLIELNQERINEGICGDCFEELNKLRVNVAAEFLPLVEALAASGVLSVFIPSDDEDAEPLEIVSAFECKGGGGLHLVAEDLAEDEEEHEAVNLLN